MRGLARALAVALLCLAAAGCQIVADRPLFERAKGEKVFGETLAVAEVKGQALVAESGEANMMVGQFRNGVYELMLPQQDGSWISFHRLPGSLFDYVVQYSTPKQITYVVARLDGNRIHVANPALGSGELDRLKARGVVLADAGMAKKVSSAADLRAVLEVWSEVNFAKQLDMASYDLHFEVGRSDQEVMGMAYRVAAAVCLAQAGHPMDEAVKTLPGKLAAGMDMTLIDAAKAEKPCSTAASAPDASPSVRYALARVHTRKGEYARAAAITDALMEQRFDLAYVMRADAMLNGFGRPRDHDGARDLLESRRHSPLIRYHLALYTANGSFGPAMPDVAAGLYQSAARSGFIPAFNGLGTAYRTGSGVPKDVKRAFDLFMIAATAGERYGHYHAGRAYYFGEGVTEDRKKAWELLEPAAQRNISDAQYIVGFMSANGQGTSKSESNAVTWYRKASDAGHVAAKTELGRMTYLGIGTTADRPKGRQLLEEAVAAGDARARDYLNALPR